MNLVNICPDIPDNWRGGRADTARILGIGLRTLDRKSALGRRGGGIDWCRASGARYFQAKKSSAFGASTDNGHQSPKDWKIL